MPHIEDVQRLQRLTDPHVESFDYFLDHGLSAGVQAIEKFELSLVDPEKLRTDPQSIDYGESPSLQFWLENPRIRPPVRPPKSGEDPQNPSLLPRECRERGLMYAGPLQATFCYRVIQRRNGFEIPDPTVRLEKDFGNMPIMVRSRYCHLRGMTPAQLVLHREEVRMDTTNRLWVRLLIDSPPGIVAKRNGWILYCEWNRTMCASVTDTKEKPPDCHSTIELSKSRKHIY